MLYGLEMLLALFAAFAVMLLPFMALFAYRWIITKASNALAPIFQRIKSYPHV